MTDRATARDTRSTQLDVLSWLTRSDSTAPSLFASWRELDYMLNGRSVLPDQASDKSVRDVAGMVRTAALWYITSDMAAVVQEASRTMPMNALLESDFPSRQGWLLFETPMDFQATDGVDVSTRAVLWNVKANVGKVGEHRGQGAMMFEWTDIERVIEDAPNLAALRGVCSLFPATLGSLHYGRVPWVPLRLPSPLTVTRPSIMDDPDIREVMDAFYSGKIDQERAPIPPRATVIRDGSLDGTLVYEYQTPLGTRVRLQPDPAWRFLAALFWMLQDRKSGTATEKRPDSKVEIKRMRKRGVRPSPITLVYWRKLSRPGSTGAGSQLQHRHLRRGHWRLHWYPSEGRHKPRYIAPTIVGDASLPWLDKPRVNVVKR